MCAKLHPPTQVTRHHWTSPSLLSSPLLSHISGIVCPSHTHIHRHIWGEESIPSDSETETSHEWRKRERKKKKFICHVSSHIIAPPASSSSLSSSSSSLFSVAIYFHWFIFVRAKKGRKLLAVFLLPSAVCLCDISTSFIQLHFLISHLLTFSTFLLALSLVRVLPALLFALPFHWCFTNRYTFSQFHFQVPSHPPTFSLQLFFSSSFLLIQSFEQVILASKRTLLLPRRALFLLLLLLARSDSTICIITFLPLNMQSLTRLCVSLFWCICSVDLMTSLLSRVKLPLTWANIFHPATYLSLIKLVWSGEAQAHKHREREQNAYCSSKRIRWVDLTWVKLNGEMKFLYARERRKVRFTLFNRYQPVWPRSLKYKWTDFFSHVSLALSYGIMFIFDEKPHSQIHKIHIWSIS